MTLVLTAEQLVKRLIALIPPRGLHLTNFHGQFASAATARSRLAPSTVARPSTSTAPPPEKTKRPRIDWATLLHRTFGCDVWRCPCGGQRRVVALVTNRGTAETMLKSLGMLHPWPPPQLAQGPPQQLELLP